MFVSEYIYVCEYVQICEYVCLWDLDNFSTTIT